VKSFTRIRRLWVAFVSMVLIVPITGWAQYAAHPEAVDALTNSASKLSSSDADALERRGRRRSE
jgi:hypothetical protein